MTGNRVPEGQDTPTGTDPEARYDRPGYEDKSLGQAVDEDMETLDRLVDEAGGDLEAAEARFRTDSAGAPALARQAAQADAPGGPTPDQGPDAHRTGEAQAEANREDDPPA